MLLIPSWRGLMARNCGGQHQRRPGLSLMGLAAFTILIRSLSLKSTDWPLHLRAPDSCGMTHLSPASGHVGPVIRHHQVTLANQQPIQGASAVKSVCSLHIHLSFSPTGCFFFLYFSLTFFLISQFEALPLLFLSVSHHCLSGPRDPLLSFFSYLGIEDGEEAEGGGGGTAGGAGSREGERGINILLCHPASWPGGERETGQQAARADWCCPDESQGTSVGTER